MATILDLSLLSEFSVVFAWLLVFGVVYGVLEVSNVFKNKAISGLIAAVVSTLMMTFSGAVTFITGIIPWFVIIAIFLVFLLVLSRSVGLKDKQILQNFGGRSIVMWIFILLAIGVMVSLIAGGQFERTETQIDPETGEVVKKPGKTALGIVTDTKVLGVIVVLGIASLAVMLMSGVPKPVS